LKVRTSFVANSSSSSFLIYLPKIPGSVVELRKMLFGSVDVNWKFRKSMDYWASGDYGTVLATMIFEKLGLDYEPVPATPEEIEEIIEHSIVHRLMESGDYNKPGKDELIHEEKKIERDTWMYKKERRKIFILRLADDEGDIIQNVICEQHEDVFGRLSYVSVHKT